MDAQNDESPLTMHEKGVSGKPTAYDRLMSSPQWKAAKARVDPDTKQEFTDDERRQGADFITESLWTKTDTDELKKRLEGKEPIFITMPSTTGQNMLPEALAGLLENEIGGSVIRGTEIARSIHTSAMKEIPAEQRPFVPREYLIVDPDAVQKEVAGKVVVIVEDVFSSGASAKAFCDTLKEIKIQVHTVAGLLGDSRLTAEPQLVNKLQKTLKHAGIESVKAKDISAILSRGQVATLIDVVNSTRGRDEQERIAENLQGIFDSRTARHLGQSVWRSKGEFARTTGEDNRNENIGERVSIDAGRQSGGGSDQVQMRNTGENNLREGGEKKTEYDAVQETNSMTATQTEHTTKGETKMTASVDAEETTGQTQYNPLAVNATNPDTWPLHGNNDLFMTNDEVFEAYSHIGNEIAGYHKDGRIDDAKAELLYDILSNRWDHLTNTLEREKQANLYIINPERWGDPHNQGITVEELRDHAHNVSKVIDDAMEEGHISPKEADDLHKQMDTHLKEIEKRDQQETRQKEASEEKENVQEKPKQRGGLSL